MANPSSERKDLVALCDGALTFASEYVISSHSDLNVLKDSLGVVRVLRRRVDSIYSPIQKREHAAWKATVAERKHLEDPLDRAENLIRSKMSAYLTSCEQERKQSAVAISEQVVEDQLSAAEEAAASGDHSLADQILSMEVAAPTPVREELPDGLGQRRTWKFEVYDVMALVRAVANGMAPPTFLSVDLKMIRTAVTSQKDGFSCPGIRTFEEVSVVHKEVSS